MIRRLIISMLFGVLINASWAQTTVNHSGAMSEMSKNQFSPTILLDTLVKKNLYGLGPYRRMQGEIMVLDGIPYIAQAGADGNGSVSRDWNSQAPFFVYANVARWTSFPLKRSVADVRELQRAIEELATENGYDLTVPFPFRITGTFTELTTHIVTPRSADIPGYIPGKNQESYTFREIKGEMLGFYSQYHQRIYTHHDSYIHFHFINDKHTIMGHVDKLFVDHSKLRISLPAKNN